MNYKILTKFICTVFSFHFIFCYANGASSYMNHAKEVIELERSLISSHISNFYLIDLVQKKYINTILESFSSVWVNRIEMGNELEAEIEFLINELKNEDISKISTDKYATLIQKEQNFEFRLSNLLTLSKQIENTINVINGTHVRNFYSNYCLENSNILTFLSLKPQPDIFNIPMMTTYSREELDIKNAADFYQKNSIFSNEQEFKTLASNLCQNIIAQTKDDFYEALSIFDSEYYLDNLNKLDTTTKYLFSAFEDIVDAIKIGLEHYTAELIQKHTSEKSMSAKNILNGLQAYHTLIRDGIKRTLSEQYIKNLTNCPSMLASFLDNFALLDFIEINIRSKFIDNLNQNNNFFKTELKENIDAIKQIYILNVNNCYNIKNYNFD